METFDFGDGPVPAHKHPSGGGWVAKTAYVDETAYLGPDALVYDDALVYGNASVFGNARVYGNASVFGNARVYGNASVFGNARVCVNASVYDKARVYDNALVYGDAMVYGNARVFGNARVHGDAWVYGKAWVYGNARVSGNAWNWGHTPAPSVESQRDLARKILEQATRGMLSMQQWHSECGTAHCVAGWCQVLSGEGCDDDSAEGLAAYESGVRHLPLMAPYFFESNEVAIEKLKEIANV